MFYFFHVSITNTNQDHFLCNKYLLSLKNVQGTVPGLVGLGSPPRAAFLTKEPKYLYFSGCFSVSSNGKST